MENNVILIFFVPFFIRFDQKNKFDLCRLYKISGKSKGYVVI